MYVYLHKKQTNMYVCMCKHVGMYSCMHPQDLSQAHICMRLTKDMAVLKRKQTIKITNKHTRMHMDIHIHIHKNLRHTNTTTHAHSHVHVSIYMRVYMYI